MFNSIPGKRNISQYVGWYLCRYVSNGAKQTASIRGFSSSYCFLVLISYTAGHFQYYSSHHALGPASIMLSSCQHGVEFTLRMSFSRLLLSAPWKPILRWFSERVSRRAGWWHRRKSSEESERPLAQSNTICPLRHQETSAQMFPDMRRMWERETIGRKPEVVQAYSANRTEAVVRLKTE